MPSPTTYISYTYVQAILLRQRIISMSSSSSCSESASSSVVYDHEPFATFRLRVLELAQSIWVGASPEEITIERMAGGGFNRIIGLSRTIGSQEEEKTQYVLRIPRFDAAQLDREIAVLQFVRRYSKLPVPEVVGFNETSNNVLGDPYMVQKRVPGFDLYSSFPKLDHTSKCRIAQQLGLFFRQMLSLRSQVAGVLVLPPDNKSLEAPLQVAPFYGTDPLLVSPYCDAPATQSMREALTSIFQARKAAALERCSTDIWRCELMDKFITMTSELDSESAMVGWEAIKALYVTWI